MFYHVSFSLVTAILLSWACCQPRAEHSRAKLFPLPVGLSSKQCCPEFRPRMICREGETLVLTTTARTKCQHIIACLFNKQLRTPCNICGVFAPFPLSCCFCWVFCIKLTFSANISSLIPTTWKKAKNVYLFFSIGLSFPHLLKTDIDLHSFCSAFDYQGITTD